MNSDESGKMLDKSNRSKSDNNYNSDMSGVSTNRQHNTRAGTRVPDPANHLTYYGRMPGTAATNFTKHHESSGHAPGSQPSSHPTQGIFDHSDVQALMSVTGMSGATNPDLINPQNPDDEEAYRIQEQVR